MKAASNQLGRIHRRHPILRLFVDQVVQTDLFHLCSDTQNNSGQRVVPPSRCSFRYVEEQLVVSSGNCDHHHIPSMLSELEVTYGQPGWTAQAELACYACTHP